MKTVATYLLEVGFLKGEESGRPYGEEIKRRMLRLRWRRKGPRRRRWSRNGKGDSGRIQSITEGEMVERKS